MPMTVMHMSSLCGSLPNNTVITATTIAGIAAIVWTMICKIVMPDHITMPNYIVMINIVLMYHIVFVYDVTAMLYNMLMLDYLLFCAAIELLCNAVNHIIVVMTIFWNLYGFACVIT